MPQTPEVPSRDDPFARSWSAGNEFRKAVVPSAVVWAGMLMYSVIFRDGPSSWIGSLLIWPLFWLIGGTCFCCYEWIREHWDDPAWSQILKGAVAALVVALIVWLLGIK